MQSAVQRNLLAVPRKPREIPADWLVFIVKPDQRKFSFQRYSSTLRLFSLIGKRAVRFRQLGRRMKHDEKAIN
jgi:hypothetical protein